MVAESRNQNIHFGQKIKIGVPIKHGFKGFMNVESIPPEGFPIEVFNEISYEFIEFKGDRDNPEYYDELISQVYYKEFHAVVGDTAITANRSDFVDFTYEFMEAGVSLLVPIEDDDTMSPWWFLKPLTTDLWVTTLIFAVLKGILVWIFERDNNPDFQGPQLVGKIHPFSGSTFVFSSSFIFIITAAGAGVLLLVYLVKLFYRRKHDEALRQILVGNGLWMKFLDIDPQRGVY
ncbi:hypothetical protein ACLOJK_040401 [Asimina triloba]